MCRMRAFHARGCCRTCGQTNLRGVDGQGSPHGPLSNGAVFVGGWHARGSYGTSGYPGGRLLGGAVRDGERGRAPSGALVRALKSSPRLSAVPCLPLHYSNLCIDLHSDRRLPHVCRDRRLIWAGCGPSVRAGAAGHVARRKKLAPDLRPFLWRCALSSSLLEKFYPF